MSRPSLARQLLASTLVGLLVLLLAGGAALSFAFRRSVESSFDARLEAWHRALVASLRVDASGSLVVDAALGDSRFEQAFSGWYWQVRSEAGDVLAASRSLWDATLALPASAPDGSGDLALSIAGPRGQTLRAVAQRVTLPRGRTAFEVVLAGDADVLRRERGRFDALLLSALGALGLGILALAALQLRVALRPLRVLEREIADVRDGARERVGCDAPRELERLVDSLNALLTHDAELVQSARAKAADLAHALKTPLSLVLAEAEELGDERGRRIARHADTMRRHVEFRLSTAVARPAVGRERTPVRTVVDAIAETLARLHPRVAIEHEMDASIAFDGAREDLEEIVGNLLENACKWARGRVSLSSRAAPEGRFSLVFDDDGPGLDETARRSVLARGVRLDERAPGSGLGLAIVADLVALYGGTLALETSPLGGLRVEVRLAAGAPLQPGSA